MPVQKRSKGSSKSKKPSRRRTMRGGYISEKIVEYLKSKGITDDQITKATKDVDPELATDDYLLNTFSNETDITEADYQKWSNVKSYPVEDDEDGEEELPVADGVAANGVAADGAADGVAAAAARAADEAADGAADGAAADEAAADEEGVVPKVLEDDLQKVAAELIDEIKGGYKKIQRQKKNGGAVAVPTEATPPEQSIIEEVDFIPPSSGLKLPFITQKPNKLTIFKNTVSEYQHIIRFIIAKNALTNPKQKPIDKIDIASINELMNTNKTKLLSLLQKYATYIQNMVAIMSLYDKTPKPIGYQYFINTYAYLDTTLKGVSGQLSVDDATKVGVVDGGKRKSKSRRGGFLDTTRIYNAQGLLSDAVDPLTAASTAGAEVERVPLPFSSRGSGTINYESDINKEFIADLLPSLGKSGGAKKIRKHKNKNI